jgi:hypothetical protein
VFEIDQNAYAVRYDGVLRRSVDADDEPHAAAVVVVGGVVKAERPDQTGLVPLERIEIIHHFPSQKIYLEHGPSADWNGFARIKQ